MKPIQYQQEKLASGKINLIIQIILSTIISAGSGTGNENSSQ